MKLTNNFVVVLESESQLMIDLISSLRLDNKIITFDSIPSLIPLLFLEPDLIILDSTEKALELEVYLKENHLHIKHLVISSKDQLDTVQNTIASL